jgi:hypothetical protein
MLKKGKLEQLTDGDMYALLPQDTSENSGRRLRTAWLKQLTKKGIYKGSTTRRMTTGSKIKGTPVHVIHLDCNAPDFISLDDYVGTEEQDAGSGSGVPDQLEEV